MVFPESSLKVSRLTWNVQYFTVGFFFVFFFNVHNHKRNHQPITFDCIWQFFCGYKIRATTTIQHYTLTSCSDKVTVFSLNALIHLAFQAILISKAPRTFTVLHTLFLKLQIKDPADLRPPFFQTLFSHIFTLFIIINLCKLTPFERGSRISFTAMYLLDNTHLQNTWSIHFSTQTNVTHSFPTSGI